MTYPDGIDALVNVNANDSLAAGGHAARHNSVNTALVEVKDYLVGALGSKLPFSFGTATPTTTTSGFLWYDSNSTPAATKFWNGSAFVPFGGKILQVVRATDTTRRSTTSTSFVDANISVTITPQTNTSAIVLMHTGFYIVPSAAFAETRITDSSNNPISGAQVANTGSTSLSGFQTYLTVIAYATPATTNAVTYKYQFKVVSSSTVTLLNDITTGQLYAIEVSA
jgi:hypothetical protein